MKKSVKFIFVIGILSGGLMLAGCERPTQSQPTPFVPEVATVTVSTQSVVLTTELPGRTSPYLVAEIRPQVNGLIQKRLFTEGSDVKAGQVLYQIDPAHLQAALDNAAANLAAMQKTAERARAALEASVAGVARQRATLELARTNRERVEAVFKDRAVSASQRDQAVTEAEVAAAAHQAAQAQVESERKAMTGSVRRHVEKMLQSKKTGSTYPSFLETLVVEETFERSYRTAPSPALWVFPFAHDAEAAIQWCARNRVAVPKPVSIIALESGPVCIRSGISSCIEDWRTIGYQMAHALIGDIPVSRTRRGYLRLTATLLERRTTRTVA